GSSHASDRQPGGPEENPRNQAGYHSNAHNLSFVYRSLKVARLYMSQFVGQNTCQFAFGRHHFNQAAVNEYIAAGNREGIRDRFIDHEELELISGYANFFGDAVTNVSDISEHFAVFDKGHRLSDQPNELFAQILFFAQGNCANFAARVKDYEGKNKQNEGDQSLC